MKINKMNKLILRRLFLMPIFRNLVVTLRAYWFINFAKSLRMFESHESYSSTIQHNLYTLSYSNNPEKFVCECVRILKPNGIIAIGVEYFDFDNYDLSNITGYSIPDNLSSKSSGYYLRSVQSIKDLFKDYLDTVYFSHDAPLKKSHTTQSLVSNPSNVFMILSINK
jgi:predicted SAM-dependent methyltransferase